jgi:hypothetical protein
MTDAASAPATPGDALGAIADAVDQYTARWKSAPQFRAWVVCFVQLDLEPALESAEASTIRSWVTSALGMWLGGAVASGFVAGAEAITVKFLNALAARMTAAPVSPST